MNILIVIVALSGTAYLAFSTRIRRSSDWKAMATPLASIMGSGFLVCAPLLAGVAGLYALPCMAALLVMAYAIGGAIRFNIREFEPVEYRGHGLPQTLGLLSRLVLAGAYFISVSYYLQLLAAFALHLAGIENATAAHAVSTGLLVLIGGIGMWRGLHELEVVERYAVSLNLSMIAALLLALMVYNTKLFAAGTWTLPMVGAGLDLHGARVVLGLLIVVQGFETSRYLGDEHPADQRVRTMRRAQVVSSAIYVAFVGLATVLFRADLGVNVTAIMQMTAPVAAVLPLLLAVTAIGSQFSAAVADNSGAGGLLEDLLHHRLGLRHLYLLIMGVTVTLTWLTNVYQIIAYASRAFALYYALQCAVAAVLAWKSSGGPPRRLLAAGFSLLACFCFAVLILGLPAE